DAGAARARPGLDLDHAPPFARERGRADPGHSRRRDSDGALAGRLHARRGAEARRAARAARGDLLERLGPQALPVTRNCGRISTNVPSAIAPVSSAAIA